MGFFGFLFYFIYIRFLYSKPTRFMSAPNYMNNVMSRFGHHLSPNQRTSLSDSMVSNLQPTKPGSGYLAAYNNSAPSASSIKNSPSMKETGVTPMCDIVPTIGNK